MENNLETQSLRTRGVSAIMSRIGASEDDLIFAGRMSLLGEKEQISRVNPPRGGFDVYHVYFGIAPQTDKQILELLGEVGLENPTITSRRGNVTTFNFGDYSLFTYANSDSTA